VSNVEGRLLWLELMKAIEAALPKDPRPADEREETAEDITQRTELHIEAMDQQHYTDLGGEWFSVVQASYEEARELGGVDPGDGSAPEEFPAEGEGELGEGALSGPGWVVQLTGYHYHNSSDDKLNQTERFVNNTLIKNLEEGSVRLPDGPGGDLVEVKFSDLGISHPWVVRGSKIQEVQIDLEAASGAESTTPGRNYGGGYEDGYGEEPGGRGPEGEELESSIVTLQRYDFIVQFVWKETPKRVRRELVEARRLQEESEQAEAGAEAFEQ
jgi:type IV pilus assembly protein PilM